MNRTILLIKKVEIEKTKHIIVLSYLKIDITIVGLDFFPK